MWTQKYLVAAALALAGSLAPPTSAQPSPGGAPTAGDLRVGTYVQVEGKIVDGVLNATQIEVYAEPVEEETLDAAVEAVDLEELTLTVVGHTVSIESETKVRDADKLPLDLFDVKVGQRAKSKGIRDGEGTLIARRIRISEFKPDKEDEVKIKGLIEDADSAAGTLSVFGMSVKYTASTEYQVGT